MSIFGQIKEQITRVADVYIRLIKVNIIGKTASLFSYIIYAMIGMFVFFCFIIFTGLAITECMIAAGLSHMAASLITAGFYFLLLFLLLALRKKITGFFAGSIIRVLTEDDDAEEDDDNE